MMNKTKLILAALPLLLAACAKTAPQPAPVLPEDESSLLTVSFADDTKATTPTSGEQAISSLHFLVFDSNGNLDVYHKCSSEEITAKKATITVKTGAKTVWALANLKDAELGSVKTVTKLKAVQLVLSDNTTSAFVMVGSADCTVSSGATPATAKISLSRLVSRVTLASVKNSLPTAYGEITINRAFLSNVVGSCTIGGAQSSPTWYNKEGVKDEETRNKSHIIDGSTYAATCPTLTFASLGSSVAAGSTASLAKHFYGYPNSSTVAPNGFNSTFAAQRTVLVVVATINKSTYYYPVVLSSAVLAANTDYSVTLTISGLGSDEPNKPVVKGSLEASVTVSDWTTGTSYSTTI